MSLNQNYSKQTVLKALHWLDEQPDNWSEYIKDSNVAVQMYLKSQNKNKEKEASFKEEITQLLPTETEEHTSSFNSEDFKKEELGAFLINKPKASPPANLPLDSSLFKKEKETSVLKDKKTLFDFLDEKSLQALRQAKDQLNIQNEEEALRILIQLGRKGLEKLMSC